MQDSLGTGQQTEGWSIKAQGPVRPRALSQTHEWGTRGESGAQVVRNKRGARQEQAGGLVRKNVGASQEQEGGESTAGVLTWLRVWGDEPVP